MGKKDTNICNEKPVVIGAAKMMEDVFESGLYKEMKTADNKLETIKKTLKQQFEDGDLKRYELPHNLIAKFVSVPIYETDEEGLKEFLDDYGLLPQTVSLKEKSIKGADILAQLKAFQKPKEYFAQFYLNKEGKKHLDKEEYTFIEDIDHLASEFLNQKTLFEDRQMSYNKIMEKITKCPFLRQSLTLKSTYGTCKLRNKEIEFYNNSIYDHFGNEFLMKYGKVSMKTIDDFIAKGYFSPTEIKSFRKIKDISLRFVVMEKDSEIKQSEFFHQQMIRRSQIRRFA
ncbi:hypothetical protein BKP35_16395 [Anaerobacillus arseniciselenatis]|uniref:Uncharacterized protein n=1 Tax=Anaerobacillus arseniciselenatis TaxID=85682 RepID=A0A1S2LBM6_9BACI|nr:hypothetical protein [Anaerobacillus arseniciselenatis]OIJ09433.1 hypothetical protein BKP35_16395 [Anaerobacillus arseniciselenatis]